MESLTPPRPCRYSAGATYNVHVAGTAPRIAEIPAIQLSADKSKVRIDLQDLGRCRRGSPCAPRNESNRRLARALLPADSQFADHCHVL